MFASPRRTHQKTNKLAKWDQNIQVRASSDCWLQCLTLKWSCPTEQDFQKSCTVICSKSLFVYIDMWRLSQTSHPCWIITSGITLNGLETPGNVSVCHPWVSAEKPLLWMTHAVPTMSSRERCVLCFLKAGGEVCPANRRSQAVSRNGRFNWEKKALFSVAESRFQETELGSHPKVWYLATE